MLRRDVFLLLRIGLDIVEFLFIDESPLIGHDGGFPPLDRILNPLTVRHQNAVRPIVRRVLEQGPNADAVKLDLRGSRNRS